jgi:type IV fimbrial biogenesis protein FimT
MAVVLHTQAVCRRSIESAFQFFPVLNTASAERVAPTHREADMAIRVISGSGGFTLIELMVVVAVASILLSLAAPAMSHISNAMRVTTGVNSLHSSLLLARSEAIKRNSRAVVCKSSTGDVCITSGGWEQGWIVFHDANNNAALDAGEALLLRQEVIRHPIRIEGNAPVQSYVSYTPMGRTSFTSGAFQAGTFTVCQESASQVDARQIVISRTGRPRTVRTTVAHCPV